MTLWTLSKFDLTLGGAVSGEVSGASGQCLVARSVLSLVRPVVIWTLARANLTIGDLRRRLNTGNTWTEICDRTLRVLRLVTLRRLAVVSQQLYLVGAYI
jgi:hypothetical protein